MPQELEVLKCYKCNVCQVHIVKKIRKWECKICGEKQSVTSVLGRGSGKACRELVQKLNSKEDQENNAIETTVLNADEESQSYENQIPKYELSKTTESKWTKYLD